MDEETRSGGASQQQLETLITGVQRSMGELQQHVRLLEVDRTEQELSACVTALEGMGIIGTSGESDELLVTIISVAATAAGAEGGSILLLDESQTHLNFEAFYGKGVSNLQKFKVELGKGIAGFVAASGQPLCVADVEKSTHWDRSISDKINFQTKSILAVPIKAGNSLLGVLEVVNKVGGEFSSGDIELMSLFAKIAGAAIERRAMTSLTAALLAGLKRRSAAPGHADGEGCLESWLVTMLEQLKASERHRQALGLATSIQKICARGPREAALCRQVVESIGQYIDRKEDLFGFGRSWKKPLRGAPPPAQP